ncbi:Protein of unknown function, partial [Gryllus bimaculatus]
MTPDFSSAPSVPSAKPQLGPAEAVGPTQIRVHVESSGLYAVSSNPSRHHPASTSGVEGASPER